MEKMNITMVPVENLRAAEYNPREMTEKQASGLEASIKEFGFVDPIIVNDHPERKNVVIGGHQRLRIAKKLRYETVPVHYVTLDADQEKKLNLRLNKNQGQWDKDALASFFDMELLQDVGFTTNDLNLNVDKFEPSLGGENGPGGEDEAGKIGNQKFTKCPNCGEEFDLR
jgi:ParB/RepB/Spo0J family partition protein